MASRLRVLVAEDDPASAELAQEILADLGFDVVGWANNGIAAVRAVVALRPDVVVMDVGMPGMDGIEATRRIQETTPTAVVALTAFETADIVERATAAGVGAYLVKPVRPQELGRAVAVATARFRDTMELRRLLGELRQAEAERRELEARVQQASKLQSLGVLAGGIAHDFNNLLAVILAGAQLAARTLTPGSPASDAVASIEQAARRAAFLSRQMLAFSGRGHFRLSPVDVAALLRDEVALRRAAAGEVQLGAELADRLPTILADADQLRQLVQSVLDNAFEAIGDRPGRVVVRASAAEVTREELSRTHVDDGLPGGLYVRLEVADDGSGIAPELRERVFDPFVTSKFLGRGLGLAAVLGIVRGHRGAVRLDSEVGRGTTVTVLLPSMLVRAAAEPSGVAPAPWRGRGTVLVVDDEPMFLAVTGDLLAALGFEVLGAGDGASGIELLRRHGAQVTAALLDLSLRSGMDAATTLQALREARPALPVLAVSGGDSGPEEAAHLGVAGVLRKPVQLSALREALRQVLGQG